MPPPLPLATPLAQRHYPAFGYVCDMIAHYAGLHRPVSAMLTLVWSRLRRLFLRLDRLALRWQAGRLTPRPPRATPRKPSAPGLVAGVKLPNAQGWLFRLCPPGTQGYDTVQRMLEDPEIIALVAAAPQAGRLLRPLCRMHAIPLPAWLRLPPRPRRPRPPSAAALRRAAEAALPPLPQHSEKNWPYFPDRFRVDLVKVRRQMERSRKNRL